MAPLQIVIEVKKQILSVFKRDLLLFQYPISTAALGVGEEFGSFQTPRGWHIIRAKIGAKEPIYSIFQKRRTTGYVYSQEIANLFPNCDWILSRILWLSGLEKGRNRLGKCDTMRRYIYIHGTHDESGIGEPKSRGCIRMCNQDIISLFDHVDVGTRVLINE